MENNPYAAPAAVVGDIVGSDAADLESRKASRGKRLGAALLDGLVNLVWMAPVIIGWTLQFKASREGLTVSHTSVVLYFLAFLLGLAVIVVNCVMLHQSGQTIGKRALDIAVVRSNGEPVALSRYIVLRVLVLGLLGMIPVVGRFVGLIDALLIFGKERRCLHDLIADTIVVDV
jgi:uncharacterized RDD family membrane protein YckC